jgi:two-component system LytT family response regulator
MNAIIIDDEKKAVENLQMLLQEFCPGVTVVATANSAKEGIEKIKKLMPDVVFLDVQMPHKSGFDLLAEITDRKFLVIFTTAYSEYAIQAFKVNAIDYLLKPIDVKQLKESVTRSEKYLKDGNYKKSEMNELLNGLKELNKVNKISISSQEGITYLEPETVLYMSADSNYTHIHTITGKKYTIAKTLKEVEETLSPNLFFRIHIATIVNLKHIDRYVRGEGGYVVMSNGTSLEVAKRRKQELLEIMA